MKKLICLILLSFLVSFNYCSGKSDDLTNSKEKSLEKNVKAIKSIQKTRVVKVKPTLTAKESLSELQVLIATSTMNKITINQLKKKRYLLLGYNFRDEHLSYLKYLDKLRELSIMSENVTVNGIIHLGQLTKLRKINFQGTPVNDEGLEKLTRLSDLREFA